MKQIISKIKNWIHQLALKIIFRKIIRSGNTLTAEYLLGKGWVKDGDYYVESNIKDRDKVWIKIDHYYYRVFHGRTKTFIALESTIEWFELYYLIIHGDNGRYDIAGV